MDEVVRHTWIKYISIFRVTRKAEQVLSSIVLSSDITTIQEAQASSRLDDHCAPEVFKVQSFA
jgi:hypothetical protein